MTFARCKEKSQDIYIQVIDELNIFLSQRGKFLSQYDNFLSHSEWNRREKSSTDRINKNSNFLPFLYVSRFQIKSIWNERRKIWTTTFVWSCRECCLNETFTQTSSTWAFYNVDKRLLKPLAAYTNEESEKKSKIEGCLENCDNISIFILRCRLYSSVTVHHDEKESEGIKFYSYLDVTFSLLLLRHESPTKFIFISYKEFREKFSFWILSPLSCFLKRFDFS